MKKFTLVWNEYIEWIATVEAESAEEAEEKFFDGGVEGEINDGQFIDYSLEIDEEEEEEEEGCTETVCN